MCYVVLLVVLLEIFMGLWIVIGFGWMMFVVVEMVVVMVGFG